MLTMYYFFVIVFGNNPVPAGSTSILTAQFRTFPAQAKCLYSHLKVARLYQLPPNIMLLFAGAQTQITEAHKGTSFF